MLNKCRKIGKENMENIDLLKKSSIKLMFILSLFCLFGFHQLRMIGDRYITVRLLGQFGNQLFEIAAAYAYSLDHDLLLTIPDLVTNSDDGIPHNAITVFLRNIASYSPESFPALTWKEPSFNYSPIPDADTLELIGYFQSEKYFAHRRKEVLELFAAPAGFNEQILAKYPFLNSKQLTVGVQLRDYRSYTPTGEYHPTMGRKYYAKALALFPTDAIFIVSSNNREFARECIEGLAKNIIYLNADYLEEFYTLVLCKSFIISNSTFGWWAAWLSTAENKKVIAPDTWFSSPYNNKAMSKDLIPSWFEVIEGANL
jgi:hypothetical protein